MSNSGFGAHVLLRTFQNTMQDTSTKKNGCFSALFLSNVITASILTFLFGVWVACVAPDLREKGGLELV